MSGPDDHSSSDSSSNSEHDIEALRTTHQEARTVLDHQIQTFRKIDDKAARTFRLDGLLLGLILTALSFLSSSKALDVVNFVNIYTLVGVILLIVSFILAVATFTVTNIRTGVSQNDIQRLVDKKYSERDWLILLLRSEGAWMDENDGKQSTNTTLLTLSHLALILAVISISIGSAVPFL
ncbi:hypothetical protein ACODNH_23590 (plasmid) [Haloarcula sp. NS06]|uniref:hypothetical protein n=1 Tax=Haloarcula sp. NS06 TaxID=3409688 RepID=UPI003DA77DE0